jgi:hypothetical protein
MNTGIDQRCAHPACHCQTRVDDPYCSDYCRRKMEQPSGNYGARCECGHEACHQQHAQERHHPPLR